VDDKWPNMIRSVERDVQQSGHPTPDQPAQLPAEPQGSARLAPHASGSVRQRDARSRCFSSTRVGLGTPL
jgi:hypothetical protein